jgi:hypothetical protein
VLSPEAILSNLNSVYMWLALAGNDFENISDSFPYYKPLVPKMFFNLRGAIVLAK